MKIAKISHWSFCSLVALALFSVATKVALADGGPGRGAAVPWTTYEAEAMTINGGTVLGPPPVAVDKNATITNTVASEASGRQCVELSGAGQYVQFTALAAANTLVARYSVPDTTDGVGADYTISLYVNGTFVQKIPVTSKYSWLYGAYPFVNTPSSGSARDFYDEARVKDLSISAGDSVRLEVDSGDAASYYIIDLVDLENIGPALTQPGGSRSVTSYGAVGNGTNDDTVAIRNCLAAGSGTVWFPPGNYLVTGDLYVSNNITVQGAGMWYTSFVGSPASYATNQYGRVRFDGEGSNLHFNDFAIIGKLNYRNDSEANDGFSETFGSGSGFSRVWVEHTKTGAWLANSTGMVIADCRFRNTIADGINLCVGMNNTMVTNCTARNTGDDSFPMWPATYMSATYAHGYNVFTHCTAQLPFFANGSAIYGGIANRIEDCLFQDIPDGAGILIAGEFSIGTNQFSGTTVAQRCDLNRCGGNDPGWRWRGALTICPQNNMINGLQVNNLNISNSLSYGVQCLDNLITNTSMSTVNVSGYALAVQPFHPQNVPGTNVYVDGVFGVQARSDAKGSLTVSGLSINGSNITSNPYPGTNYPYPGTFITNQAGANFAFIFAGGPGTATVTATPVSSGQMNLNWTTVSGAASYNVKRSTVNGGSYTTIASGVTATAYSDTGLSAGTTYYYVVSAVVSGSEGLNSSQASALTFPAAPTGLSAAALSSSQIKLTWTASSGAASYNVKSSTVSGGSYTTIATGVIGTTYTNSGRAASTTYYYVVSAVNAGGESDNSSPGGATTSGPTLPAAPTGLTAMPGNAQVTLNWNASSGATSYNVKLATVNGGPYTTIVSPTTTNYVNAGRANGTPYYYVVSAVNSVGESTNSAQVSATPTSAAILLSQGRPVTASSFQTGNDATNGNDGILTNRWAASGPSLPQWWRVDLGASYSLGQVVIDWYNGSSRYYQYRIETSSDDTNYATVVDETGNTTYGNTTANFSATARYVRITMTGVSQANGYASFSECQVYGTSPPPSIALNPTNVLVSLSGNVLSLSWPADHLGWHLQSQTNTLGTGLGTNWVTLSGSDLVTGTNITINPGNNAVYYRLVYQ
jgi:fibronectin type 3 domain-containing protein